ncbi:semaphorin-4B isoform X3 [Poecile atricapillus]|uniref:semaphorin-4B isoform X3 n=1 Tax=Poecile atricapillus TaxID=48891 RepID=UPI0027392417|nr:semaphorin-4B isoform X3 [Poecile atricapillus]
MGPSCSRDSRTPSGQLFRGQQNTLPAGPSWINPRDPGPTAFPCRGGGGGCRESPAAASAGDKAGSPPARDGRGAGAGAGSHRGGWGRCRREPPASSSERPTQPGAPAGLGAGADRCGWVCSARAASRPRRSPAARSGMAARPVLPVLAALLLSAAPEPVPRVSLPYDSAERVVRRFEAPGVSNYTALLLSPDGGTLYLGARELLLTLNTSNFQPSSPVRRLLWSADEEKKRQCVFKGKDPQRDCHNYIKLLLQLNSTHLYTCGTCAFSPACAYINVQHFSLERDSSGKVVLEDGKGRCPFDPEYRSTAVMVDGELYAGTVSNFQGNEPTISRSQESRIALKTENSLNWLQDPAFVGSAYLRESLPAGNPEGDDDKVYFFFSETGKEFDYFENTIVSRIARVCKGDQGGERVLQRRWTTFLKAQLLCSHPEDGFPFNVLQDIFVLTPGELRWRETLFYGVFTSQWNKGGLGSSAVCAFPMRSVQRAFGGLYKEVNRETQQWYTDTSPVPEPRPGMCITSRTRHLRINSSLQMPDRVLNFIKDHFLMDSPVRSQPLLLQSHRRYQRIGVHRAQGLHATYDVLFLGTDDGRLHKAVRVNHGVHIIEEIRLFPDGQPILQLLLDQDQAGARGLVYAATYTAVAQVPFANCSLYRSCGECVLARDPFCAWSRGACRRVTPHPPAHPQLWVQDIEDADTERLCQLANASQPRPRILLPPASGTPCQQIQLPPNAVRPLPCRLLSNLASRHWLHNGAPVNASYLVLPDGALILVGSPERTGTYECWSLEEGFRKLMASYCVGMQEPALGPANSGRKVAAGHDTLETVSTSRSTSAVGSAAARLDGKTYWTEFLVMCVLFAAAVLVLAFFVLHRHRDGMKALLEPGDPSRHQKPPRKPVESLPLNGSSLPSTAPEHKGYQALQDNYIVSTPVHEPPGPPRTFSESEKRPLHVRDSFVEVSPACQRPRVRLGSEIQDSVV